MPNPIPGREAIDLGGGLAATQYDDGSTVVWDITTGQQVSYLPPGATEPGDLGNGQALSLQPGGGLSQYDITSGQGSLDLPAISPTGQVSLPGLSAPSAPTALSPWAIPWGQPGSVASGPQAAAAGTTGTPYGFGWIQRAGQPGYPVPINPANLQYLVPQYAPGYIPGSGMYNQYSLDRPLFDAAGHNLQWGGGGPGDPNTGTEAQTPQDWLSGDRLFNGAGTNLEGQWEPVANNYLRSDTPTGIGTPQAPDWLQAKLVDAVRQGMIVPTARGWQYLQSVAGQTPQSIGGAAAGLAQQAGAAGMSGAAGSVQSTEDLYWQNRAKTESADQAARLVYQDWLMRTGDDKLAMDKAHQAWTEKMGEQSFGEQQRQFNQGFGLQEAGVTGTYNGTPTLARTQLEAQIRQADLQLTQRQQQIDEARRAGDLDRAQALQIEQDRQRFSREQLAQQAQQFGQTFGEQQRQFNQGFGLQEAGVTGTYQGQPTFAAQQANRQFGLAEAGVTGTYNGAPTEQRIGREQATAMGLLNLGSQLSGPSNYFQYLRTLGNTPEGMRSLVGGLAGQYQFAASPGATPGAAYQRQTLGTLTGDYANAPGAGMAGSDLSGITLPSGNQWNARNAATIFQNPTQAGLLRSAYQESGRSFDDELAAFKSSLPRYTFGGAAMGRVSYA